MGASERARRIAQKLCEAVGASPRIDMYGVDGRPIFAVPGAKLNGARSGKAACGGPARVTRGVGYAWGPEAKSRLAEAAKELVKAVEEAVGRPDVLSERVAEARLHGLLDRVRRCSSPASLVKNAEAELEQLIEELSRSVKRWQACVPLEGVRFVDGDTQLPVGRVMLRCWRELDWPLLRAASDLLDRKGRSPSAGPAGAIRPGDIAWLWQRFEVVAVVDLEAEEQTAVERAVELAWQAADILQCFALYLPTMTHYPRKVSLAREAPARMESCVLYDAERDEYRGRQVLTVPAPMSLGRAEVDQLSGRGLNEVNEAMAGQDELAKVIARAIWWLARSIRAEADEQKIPLACIALEKLLGSSRGGIADWLSRTAAFLIGETLNERRKVYSDVKKLYDDRSRVVHGGQKKEKEPDPPWGLPERGKWWEAASGDPALALQLYAVECITRVARMRAERGWNSISRLREWVEQQTFGVPENI